MVGLGNPGADYVMTRHNAGWWFVDALARAHGGTFSAERKFHGDVCRVSIAGH
ncbi:MAG TPA: aminoacyl-tRNA hydrolase, partial [Gammaproteobacteria bacterium]